MTERNNDRTNPDKENHASAKGAVAGGATGGVAGGAIAGSLAGGVTGPVGAAIGAVAGAGAGALAGKAAKSDDDGLTGTTGDRLTGDRSTGDRLTTGRIGDSGTDQVIPVVQEELEVGKRTVQSGGVRVEARLVEDTVRESVDLREERAHVERRPVDRPATEADLNGLRDRTIEVQETTERPVVQKTARVVEEVAVGKEVRQTQADINETVRHTEVDVQRIGGNDRSRAYGDYEQDFRADFSTRYGSGGQRYEDVEPAYRFGHSLASEPRYRGRNWEDFEADARTDWGRSNSGSTWESMKDTVRHAWQRAKS